MKVILAAGDHLNDHLRVLLIPNNKVFIIDPEKSLEEVSNFLKPSKNKGDEEDGICLVLKANNLSEEFDVLKEFCDVTVLVTSGGNPIIIRNNTGKQIRKGTLYRSMIDMIEQSDDCI